MKRMYNAVIIVALCAEECFKKALNSKLWRREYSICPLLIIKQTLIALAFTRGQQKLTKLWKKTCNRCPHRQQVTFHAGHAESTIPWNSELSARVTDPSGPVLPCCSQKHEETFESNVGRRETCLLAMRVGLDDHGLRDRKLLLVHPLAKKSSKQLLTDPHEHSQMCYLYFRAWVIHGENSFLRGQPKLTKNSRTDFTLLATIVKIVAQQPNFVQEAQYTTKTTILVATQGDEENKQNSKFSLVYFLALFLSRNSSVHCFNNL